MSHKKYGLLIIGILLLSTVLIAGCTQSLSQAPKSTATVIPTGAFVLPLPSSENPMEAIQQFAQETSAAQTATANGGTPATPATPITATAETLTPQTGITPTNAIATTAVAIIPTITPGGPTLAPLTRPQTYILQKDEFPYCIARRYNVDPQQLLQLSGLTSPDVYYEGLKLTIPQSGSWPGSAVLRNHPDTYTVTGNEDTTVYGVACKYGNVDPNAIASINGITATTKLTIGQKLQIP